MNYKRNQKYLEKFATQEVNARIIERPTQIAYGYLLYWHYESLGNPKLNKKVEDANITDTFAAQRWTMDVFELLDATRMAYVENVITLNLANRTLTILDFVQLPSLYASWQRVKEKSKSKDFFKRKEFLKLLDDIFANSLLALREDVEPIMVKKGGHDDTRRELAKFATFTYGLMKELEKKPTKKVEIVVEYIRTLYKIAMMANLAVKEGYLTYKEGVRVFDEINFLSKTAAERANN